MYQLKLLCSQEKNKVYIISSSTKSELEQNFKDNPELGLACEYGFYYKPPRETDYHQLIYIDDWTWKQGIMPILNGFTERTEGSYIIQKESMISWNYKNCESDFGQFQANEMISHIKTLLFQNDFIIVEDNIEKNEVNIRPKNINKGFFIAEILKQDNINGEFPNLILGIGDKDGGEDMFKYLNYLKNNFSEIKANIFSTVVNKRISSANYYLNDANEILEIIENFNKIDKSEDNYSSSKFSQDISNDLEKNDSFELEMRNLSDDTL
jgi:trehalose 6-phosphate synthase/phosphatase